MKKGKRFFAYISSVTFGLFFILLFSSCKVSALDESNFEFACYDKNDNEECDLETSEKYYVLTKINIDDPSSVNELEIPSTHDDFNVEKIASNVINSSESLNLETLTLPENLLVIENNAFNNIASLKSVTIPTTVTNIGANIFASGANVESIYLNHFNFLDIMQSNIEIDENAFADINLTRIICERHDVYNYYVSDPSSTLKNAPVTTLVTYTYYTYENEEKDDVTDTKQYYVGRGQTISEIPTDLEATGLNFLGWYLKIGSEDIRLEEGMSTLDSFTLYTYDYKVYPHYELKPLTFTLDVKNETGESVNPLNTNFKYNGSKQLLSLNVTKEKMNHELLDSPQFSYSVAWKKLNENLLNQYDDVASGESLSLSFANQSGTYRAIVTYTYNYNDKEYTGRAQINQTINIAKAPLYITIEDITKTYGEYINQEEINYVANGLLNDDEITIVNYEFNHSGNILVGKYFNNIKVAIQSITNSEEERISNYEILYAYGTYIVNPKTIEVAFTENDSVEVEYGDEIVLSKVYNDNGAYGSIDNEITVYFAKEAGVNKGIYSVIGVSEISNTNYMANFNSELSVGKLTINAKKVETHADLDSRTYNGERKKLEVYYLDANNSKVLLNYLVYKDGELVNEIVNAGSYIVSIDSLDSANYEFSNDDCKNLQVDVAKAMPTVTYSSYQTFTYSGSKINPLVRINNDEQTPTFSCMLGGNQGDYCKDSGEYNVVVTYQESENYQRYVTNAIILSISKFTINLSPKSYNFYYGEPIVVSEEININGETVIAKYSTSVDSISTPELGTYNIVGVIIKNALNGADHPNYNGSILVDSGTDKIHVVKRPIEIVYYNYTNLVYNGNERYVGAYAVDGLNGKVIDDLGIRVVSDEGTIKDAKTYHLRAYFENEHYFAKNSNLLIFTIEKAKYDLSNIKLNDARFTLDFNRHSINIEGVLPEGVSVTYTIDGKEGNSTAGAFKHKVVASFIFDTNNYVAADNLEATIYIDMTWVFVTLIVFIFLVAILVVSLLLYADYRRVHPKKIKLKIKNMVDDDLESKRIATSVNEALGDQENKEEEKEVEEVESEDDLVGEGIKEQTFIERIYAADSELKYYYSEVKNELLSYEGITHTVDRKYEVFYHGTRTVAKLSICNNILRLYVNLDPEKYDVKQYNHRDMSDFEEHARTPLRINVNSSESLRHAKIFIRILRKKENLKAASSFVRIDYEKFYTLKENIFPKIFKKMFSINDKNKKE